MSEIVKAQKNHSHLDELRFPKTAFMKKYKILKLRPNDLVCTFGHFKTKLLDFGVVTTVSELNKFLADAKEEACRNCDSHSARYFDLDNCNNMLASMFSYVEDVIYKRIVDFEERDILIEKLEEEFRGYPSNCFSEIMQM